jgi:hypothetical protein
VRIDDTPCQKPAILLARDVRWFSLSFTGGECRVEGARSRPPLGIASFVFIGVHSWLPNNYD